MSFTELSLQLLDRASKVLLSSGGRHFGSHADTHPLNTFQPFWCTPVLSVSRDFVRPNPTPCGSPNEMALKSSCWFADPYVCFQAHALSVALKSMSFAVA